jgi:hypothetical protein
LRERGIGPVDALLDRLARSASEHPVAHGGEPSPQIGEPVHGHQLEFDHLEKAFNDHETDSVSRNHIPVPVSQCPWPATNMATIFSGSTSRIGKSINASDW